MIAVVDVFDRLEKTLNFVDETDIELNTTFTKNWTGSSVALSLKLEFIFMHF